MNLSFDQRVEELFDHAADLPPDQRRAFLEQNCQDAEAIARVWALLEHADRADERFLAGTLGTDGNTDLLSPAGEAPPISGQRLGPYTLLRLLGEGGMGAVYEAEQDHPRRRVALKLIRPGFMTAGMMRRFEYEADVLGRLEHPGIARIYHAGTVDTSHGKQPYFAMELVHGTRLDHWIKQHDPPTRKRCELLAAICQAVHHAHTKGVIHRDLKPANILVTDDGQPKVLDFGVARAIDSDIQTVTLHTESGQMVGTLPYMAPEQAAGKVRELDTASDVYALGVIAYEVLSGRLPYPLEGKPLHEAVRVICEAEPSRLGSVDRSLRGDVETIVLKALEKDKTRRYHTAGELAADVKRFLNYEPITARPPSSWDQLAKFARRNKGLVGSLVAIFALLLGGVVGMAFLAAKAQHHAAVAERRAAELDAVASFQAEQLAGIDVPRMGQRLREDLLERAGGAGFDEALAQINFTDVTLRLLDEHIFQPALHTIDQRFTDQPAVQARLLQSLADTLRELGLLARAGEPQERALALRREALGSRHPDTLISISRMGTMLRVQGRLEQAEQYHREALHISRQLHGDEHQDTLVAMHNLAVLLRTQGKLTEAEPYFRQALDGARRVLGEDHPQTLDIVTGMGIQLRAQGRLAEAEPYYRRGLEGRLRVFGKEHPQTLIAINNMAYLLQALGRLSEAEPLFREVLDLRRHTLGSGHPSTLTSLNNLGMLLWAKGRLDEAEPLVREALEGSRRVLGDDHIDTLGSLNNIALLLMAQGRLEDAEPYLHETIERCRAALGPDHPDTLGSLNSLGTLLQAQRRWDEAEPVCREAMERSRRTLGPLHPHTLRTTLNLARVKLGQERFADAEPLLADVYHKSFDVQVSADDAAMFAVDYGVCLTQLGRYDAAVEPLLEAHRRLQHAATQDGDPLRRVVSALAESCRRTDRPREAAHWRRVLATLESMDDSTNAAGTDPS